MAPWEHVDQRLDVDLSLSYISQLMRYSRACGFYLFIINIETLLTRKIQNFTLFRKLYGRHHDLVKYDGISVSQMTTDMFRLQQSNTVLSRFLTYYRILTCITLRVPLVKQKLFTLLEYPNQHPFFSGAQVIQFLVFCRPLFAFLSLFLWLLYCLIVFRFTSFDYLGYLQTVCQNISAISVVARLFN